MYTHIHILVEKHANIAVKTYRYLPLPHSNIDRQRISQNREINHLKPSHYAKLLSRIKRYRTKYLPM